jgi:hypothetical protein
MSTTDHVFSGTAARLYADDGAGAHWPLASRKRRTASGGYVVQDVKQPPAIHRYALYFDGVDTMDQRVAEYSTQLASKRWYVCLFFKALDIAISNAFALHRLATEEFTMGAGFHGRDCKFVFHGQLEFRCKLVEALLLRAGVAWRSDSEADLLRTAGRAATAHHLPCVLDAPRACVHCSPDDSRTVARRPRVKTACSACDKALCLTAERNCFEEYHKALFCDSFPK